MKAYTSNITSCALWSVLNQLEHRNVTSVLNHMETLDNYPQYTSTFFFYKLLQIHLNIFTMIFKLKFIIH